MRLLAWREARDQFPARDTWSTRERIEARMRVIAGWLIGAHA